MDIEMQERMKNLMDQSERFMNKCGYEVRQINGQRKSTLRNYDLSQSAKSNTRTEVFIGKLPRDVFEIELFPLMRRAGLIVELRVMMDFSGTTRGFAFVKYSSASEAMMAVRTLNDCRIRFDCPPIGVVESFDNRRLYFGNLPFNVGRESLMRELEKLSLAVEDVQFLESLDPHQPGHAIVTFETHEEATKARRILVPGDVKIYNRIITIDWAKPDKNKPIENSSLLDEFDLIENINSFSLNSSGSSGIHLTPNQSISSIKATSPSIDFNNNVSLIDISNYYQNNINVDSGIDILGDKTKRMLSSLPNNHQSRSFSNDFNSLNYQPSLNPLFVQVPLVPSINRYQQENNVLIISNIDFTTVTINQLKTIFQLNQTFPINDIYRSGFTSVTIQYENPKHAHYMLHTLRTKPNCFQNIVLPECKISCNKAEFGFSVERA